MGRNQTIVLAEARRSPRNEASALFQHVSTRNVDIPSRPIDGLIRTIIWIAAQTGPSGAKLPITPKVAVPWVNTGGWREGDGRSEATLRFLETEYGTMTVMGVIAGLAAAVVLFIIIKRGGT